MIKRVVTWTGSIDYVSNKWWYIKEYKDRIGAGMLNKYLDALSFSSVHFELNKPFEITNLNRKSSKIEEWYLKGLYVATSWIADDFIAGMAKFIALDKSRRIT